MSRRRFMGKTQKEYIVEITSTGDWPVPEGCTSVNIFLVGGGAGGGTSGGGGGYTKTVYGIAVTPKTSIKVVIGPGGAGNRPYSGGERRGTTSFGDHSVEGGYGSSGPYAGDGGNGGSGGNGGNGGQGIICLYYHN